MVDSLPSRSDNQSYIPQIKTESQDVEQPSSSLEQFRLSTVGLDESSPIPQSSSSYPSSSSCEVFLMPDHEIAQGNSITSTVVNLLVSSPSNVLSFLYQVGGSFIYSLLKDLS